MSTGHLRLDDATRRRLLELRGLDHLLREPGHQPFCSDGPSNPASTSASSYSGPAAAFWPTMILNPSNLLKLANRYFRTFLGNW